MSTKNPRLMVVLEPPLYDWVKKTAKKQGLSISLVIRDLLKEAYNDKEELYWAKEGEKRLDTFKPASAISHEELKRRLSLD